jgi:capsid protein
MTRAPVEPAALLAQLRPLAQAFARARSAERRTLLAWHRAGNRSHTPEHRSAALAQDKLIQARRALADAVSRVLVRGHAVACNCATCTTERRLVSDLLPLLPRPPRPSAARRRKSR